MITEEIQVAARIIARRCRFVIQGCLREEEWPLADEEFARIAQEAIEELAKGGK